MLQQDRLKDLKDLLAGNIASEIAIRNMTLRQVAERSGIPVPTIWRILKKKTWPKANQLYQFAWALGLESPSAFFSPTSAWKAFMLVTLKTVEDRKEVADALSRCPSVLSVAELEGKELLAEIQGTNPERIGIFILNMPNVPKRSVARTDTFLRFRTYGVDLSNEEMSDEQILHSIQRTLTESATKISAYLMMNVEFELTHHLAEMIAKEPYVSQCYTLVGGPDIIVRVFAPSKKALDDMVLKLSKLKGVNKVGFGSTPKAHIIVHEHAPLKYVELARLCQELAKVLRQKMKLTPNGLEQLVASHSNKLREYIDELETEVDYIKTSLGERLKIE